MIYIFIISLFIGLLSISYFILDLFLLSTKKQLIYRIRKYMPKETTNIYDTPLLTRLVEPLINIINKYIVRIIPIKYKNHLEDKLKIVQNRYTLQELISIKIILIAIVMIVLVVYGLVFSIPNAIVVILSLAIAFYFPDFIMSLIIKKNKKDIQNELPFFIEILAVILEGGVGFDSALVKICGKRSGPIYDEFRNYNKELSIGSPRGDALNNLADRVMLQDMNYLVKSIIQGEKMGISITSTIRVQAEQIRNKRKQRIQERVNKIPIKIAFPLIFFIFPPIFLIILGPAVISIFQNLF